MERYQVVGHLRLDPEGTVASFADAQAQIEALQRERDEAKDDCVRVADLCKEVLLRAHFFIQYREQRKMEELESACEALNKPLKGLSAIAEQVIDERDNLRAALDAEREKAAQQGRYAVDLFDEIQRMKKAWCEERACFESDLVKAETERDKLQALVRALPMLRSLDATTPATTKT